MRLCNHFADKHPDINYKQFKQTHSEYVYVSPKMHKQLSDDTYTQWEDPMCRINKSNATKRQWEIEEYRKMMSDKMRARTRNFLDNDIDGSYHKMCITNLGHSYGGRIEYKGNLLRSDLELHFAKLFDAANISFEYETIQIPYYDNGIKHIYFPDFYLPEYNLLVEVKPKVLTYSTLNKLKMKATKDLGYNIVYALPETTLEEILNSATTIENVS